MFDHRRSGAESEAPQASSVSGGTAIASAPHTDPRRRLLQAMIATVALRGYDRTTLTRVLTAAGVEEAVFTEHFRDKHDCFAQAVDELICRAEMAALELFGLDLPWPERVRRGLRTLLDALARDPDGARVVLVEMLATGPAESERQRAALALFASLIEEGRALCRGGAHLPPQTAEAIVGGVASILHRRVLQGEAAMLPALRADLTYFTLLPFLDHERALAVAGGEDEDRSPA